MEQENVLIAGFSGRALAQSARRAGFVPLVVDGFGDEDTRAAAHACEVLTDVASRGFRERSLVGALDRLAMVATSPPLGLVLGSGFEDAIGLVERLGARYRLIGCASETIRRAKDPVQLASLLRGRGIAHPDIRLEPPEDGAGWLSKRIGATGGTHVRSARAQTGSLRGRYFQREVRGRQVSALGMLGGSDCAFAFSRQWTAPLPSRPFRFGGAAGSLELDPDLEARMIEIGLEVARELALLGLISLDFLIADDMTPILIEVNPRPGATLDVFDDARGTLFSAHVSACLGATSLAPHFAAWAPPVARAVAYLYADKGRLDVPALDLPDWVLDRPATGRRIALHQPVATVVAEGPHADSAEALCRARLGTLERMLYEKRTGKEAQP